MTLPAAQRLRHGAVQLAGQEEPGDRQQHERRAPADRGRDVAGDDEADRGAADLTAEDVGIDPAALTGGEIVAGERGDRGTGGGDHGPQQQAGQEQRRVAAGKGAEQRGEAPQHDAQREHRDALRTVHQQADR